MDPTALERVLPSVRPSWGIQGFRAALTVAV